MPVVPVPDHDGRARPSVDTARRWWITAASALPLLPPTPPPVLNPGGPVLSVVAANLERGQRDPRTQAEALAALDADVLLLTEHCAATQALEKADLRARFPHLADDPQDEGYSGYFGTLVASRHPFTSIGADPIGGRPAQVVDIDVDGVVTRLVPVHTQAPIWDRDVATWHDTVEANAAVADDAPGPVVLAGDWNATGGHRRFRGGVARHGLVDASAVLGHRWYPTWPVDLPVLRLNPPPFLTLDHVVVSDTVEVVALERLSLPGSDHRGLRAELRLPPG